jgi:hypothetical protein
MSLTSKGRTNSCTSLRRHLGTKRFGGLPLDETVASDEIEEWANGYLLQSQTVAKENQ